MCASMCACVQQQVGQDSWELAVSLVFSRRGPKPGQNGPSRLWWTMSVGGGEGWYTTCQHAALLHKVQPSLLDRLLG